jgi:hypothetical protein
MAYEQTSSGLLAGIDKAIAQLEAQAKELQAAAPYGSAQRGAAAPAAASAPAPSLDDMALTISHLKQIKDWFEHDERLLPVVDSFIGQKVKASEKRTNAINTWIAVATTVVGAILGWLVSSLQSPAALLSRFGH